MLKAIYIYIYIYKYDDSKQIDISTKEKKCNFLVPNKSPGVLQSRNGNEITKCGSKLQMNTLGDLSWGS